MSCRPLVLNLAGRPRFRCAGLVATAFPGLVLMASCGAPAPESHPPGAAADRALLEASHACAARADEVPDDAENWFRWGLVLLELGSVQAAEDKFAHVAGLDPTRGKSREFLGHALFAQGRFAEAYAAYREAARRGRDTLGLVEVSRSRIGELVRHAQQRPGLGGLVLAAAPDLRWSAVARLRAFEALGVPRETELRAVDRLLVRELARSDSPALSDGLVLDYLEEVDRAVRLPQPGPLGSETKAREMFEALARVAEGALSGVSLEWTDGALLRRGDRVVGPDPALDLVVAANQLLARGEAERRLVAIRAPDASRRVAYLTPAQASSLPGS